MVLLEPTKALLLLLLLLLLTMWVSSNDWTMINNLKKSMTISSSSSW